MRIKKKDNIWILLLYLYYIVSLILINYGIHSLQFVAFIVSVFFAALSPVENIIIEMAILIPLGQLARFPGSFTAFPFLAIIAVFKILVKSKRNISIDTLQGMCILAIGFVGIISALIQFGSIKECIPFICYLLLISLSHKYLIHTNKYNFVMKKIMYCFIISMIITCLGSIFLPGASSFFS